MYQKLLYLNYPYFHERVNSLYYGVNGIPTSLKHQICCAILKSIYHPIYSGGVFLLKIALCDDCESYLYYLKDMIRLWKHPSKDLNIELFLNGETLIKRHTQDPFDIIFLDVVMPLFNGIDIAEDIRKFDRNVKLVFLTAFSDFAVASYTVKANNYLVKPVSQTDLYKCLDEFSEEILKYARSINIKGVHAIYKIHLENIEYIESQNKHILFSLTDGRTILSAEPLYTYENKLLQSDGFFKCHRGYLINLHHIDTYTQKEVKMRSGYRIPISRKCAREFENAYFSEIFGKAGDIS